MFQIYPSNCKLVCCCFVFMFDKFLKKFLSHHILLQFQRFHRNIRFVCFKHSETFCNSLFHRYWNWMSVCRQLFAIRVLVTWAMLAALLQAHGSCKISIPHFFSFGFVKPLTSLLESVLWELCKCGTQILVKCASFFRCWETLLKSWIWGNVIVQGPGLKVALECHVLVLWVCFYCLLNQFFCSNLDVFN